jgi:type IV pilus assembly protein PilB
MAKRRLGDLMVEMGFLTPAQLEVALKEQRRTGELLGQTLERLGFVSPEKMALVLAAQAGIPFVNLKETRPQQEAIEALDEDLAREFHVLPLEIKGNTLVVATDNPYDILSVDNLKERSKRDIEIRVAEPDLISTLIDEYYGAKGITDKDLELAVQRVLASLGGEGLESPLIEFVEKLIGNALKEGCTDIHIDPGDRVTRIKVRLDGVLYQKLAIPKDLHPATVNRIKILAELDISEQRVPQDGRIGMNIGGKEIDIRVSTLPTVRGEAVVMRLLDKGRLLLGLEDLGFSEENYLRFKELINKPFGMILVTGPTGSGKTTTLYAALSSIDVVSKNVMTIEDPVEYEISMVRQSQINPQAGFTFASGLRSALRQDPDVILVGEIRDKETADMAIRASLTGHLLFSTLHTNDAAGTITRLIDIGVSPFLLPSTLLAAIAQRLVRRVCQHCKESYEASQREKELLGVPGDQPLELVRGKGCPYCRNTGYKGRIAVFEMLTMNPEIEELVLNNAPSSKIKRAAVENGMADLRQDCIDKVLAGKTTVEELVRVIG